MDTISSSTVPTRELVPATTDMPGADQDRSPLDATRRLSAAGDRALVLGGGGSTGNAWLIGVMAGLTEGGLDVTAADRIVGTSAGSTAGAQVMGWDPMELLAATLADAQHRPRPDLSHRARASGGAVADHMERMHGLIASASDAADLRRRIGAAALAMDASSDPSVREHWRATVAARMPAHDWAERHLLITAVDAATGEPVVFDRDSGVDLVDAVAASCASGFAYRIGDGRYIDGGFRRGADNADLAAGHTRVLVLAPFGGRSLTPPEWGLDLATQLDELRAGGSLVETVVPPRDVDHLFGPNAMDLSLRPAAARLGHDQGTALAARLTGFWG